MRRPTVAVLALAILGGSLVACGSDEPARACASALVAQVRAVGGDAAGTNGPLDWVECRGGAEVAALAVPIDREQPAGGDLVLAIARRPASGDRIGSLLVNPGGPGASALGLALLADDVFPTALTERFDIVAWDPRGVGLSEGFDCVDDATMARWWGTDRSPDDAAERAAVVAAGETIAAGCARQHPDALGHVATVDTVHDVEAIRVALGDDTISYLGFSYGTLIGARYADEFPDRVRAMVLDGAVDPARTTEQAIAEQAAGFEHALEAFLDDCAAQDDCAFTSGGDPRTAYDRLLAAIDAEELYAVDLAGDERGLGPGEADLGVATGLYDGRAGWPRLAEALGGAARGDASQLLQLADEYAQRSAEGVYDDGLEASYAIGCLDGPQPTPAQLRRLADELARELPHFGAATAWYGAPCASWSAPPKGAPREVRAAGAPPIVVIGTTGDPASPYEWAESLAGQLADGVLVTHDDEGHLAYLRGDACVDEAVHRYLVDLVVPDPGTRC